MIWIVIDGVFMEEKSQGSVEFLLMMILTVAVLAGLVIMIDDILTNWTDRITLNMEEASGQIMSYLSGS